MCRAIKTYLAQERRLVHIYIILYPPENVPTEGKRDFVAGPTSSWLRPMTRAIA